MSAYERLGGVLPTKGRTTSSGAAGPLGSPHTFYPRVLNRCHPTKHRHTRLFLGMTSLTTLATTGSRSRSCSLFSAPPQLASSHCFLALPFLKISRFHTQPPIPSIHPSFLQLPSRLIILTTLPNGSVCFPPIRRPMDVPARPGCDDIPNYNYNLDIANRTRSSDS
jgi:hypothetical protein